METFVHWVKGRIAKENKHEIKNGILYLKGGDLKDELSGYKRATLFPLNDFFEEAYYDTKCVVHLPMKFRR
jgi:16S rRNA (guanine527-N7)-methyltransferase